MATRDWASLGWDPNLSFALPTERQLAQSSIADAGKGAESRLATTAQNLDLLRSLGYTGSGFTNVGEDYGAQPVWSDEARTWLANNGYNVGVAHDPGTSPGGRPEYWGLTGPDGKFVQGQSDPTMTISDTMMDNITPFLMMAPAFAGVMGAAGSGASAGAGGLGSVADGVSALGSAWSPEALGLTGAITPGVSAAELAGLSAGIPGAVEVAGGLGAAGGLSSMGGGGVSSLGSAWSPTGLGLTTPIAPGATGAEIAAASTASTGLPGAVSLPGVPTASIGGSGGMSSADKAALYGNGGYGPGMTGAQTSAYDNLLNLTGSKNIADLGSSLTGGIGNIADLVGGANNLAGLIGAGLGAASGGGSETSSRDPWSAAQPYLKNILADAEKQRANLAANPFTPQQTQQYQQAYAGLDQARAALPGLLNWSQNAMQRQSTTPSYASLFGGAQPSQQPIMQAGGTGGLLGDQDRMKALMARGRGLIG